MESENQTLFKHMEFEYGLNLTETQLSEIVAICRTILLPNQNSEIANWCIVNALRLPPTTLALVVEKLSQHVHVVTKNSNFDISETKLRMLAKKACNGHQHAMRYNSMLSCCYRMGEMVVTELNSSKNKP
jgi:hypothetical protein